MKLSRITLHAALGILVLVGFAGSVVTAAGTSTGKSSSSNASKSTSSSASSATSTTATTPQTTSNGTLQGYAADSVLQDGTIVQLDPKNSAQVDPATQANIAQMYGVTVDPHLLSLTVSNASLTNEVYVATAGTYDVLVSSQGGTIAPGDYITISSVDGTGMKADTSVRTVFGRAVGGFDGKTNVLGSTTLKTTAGATSQVVALGIIPVTINIQRNPNQISTEANLPKALQRVGEAIAQKPVSEIRIYLSIVVTGLSIIVAIVTLYAGVRNAIISIGRNPLSKKTIFRGLLEVILTGFLILIIGLFAVYLLLKL